MDKRADFYNRAKKLGLTFGQMETGEMISAALGVSLESLITQLETKPETLEKFKLLSEGKSETNKG